MPMTYWHSVPLWFQRLFPAVLWRVETTERRVFLTFDDGPSARLTDFILDNLSEYRAKASFFCIGRQIEQQPEVFARLLAAGHTVGNHTYTHPRGWRVSSEAFLDDVARCQPLTATRWFRPPYGQLRRAAYRQLKHNYRIVGWDIMNGDFLPDVTAETALEVVRRHVRPGSIVCLHDKERIGSKVRDYLPKLLAWLRAEGYAFGTLDELGSDF